MDLQLKCMLWFTSDEVSLGTINTMMVSNSFKETKFVFHFIIHYLNELPFSLDETEISV